jgi:hypothetical protein
MYPVSTCFIKFADPVGPLTVTQHNTNTQWVNSKEQGLYYTDNSRLAAYDIFRFMEPMHYYESPTPLPLDPIVN